MNRCYFCKETEETARLTPCNHNGHPLYLRSAYHCDNKVERVFFCPQHDHHPTARMHNGVVFDILPPFLEKPK